MEEGMLVLREISACLVKKRTTINRTQYIAVKAETPMAANRVNVPGMLSIIDSFEMNPAVKGKPVMAAVPARNAMKRKMSCRGEAARSRILEDDAVRE